MRTDELLIWAEITEACQIKCRFCYNPWRSVPEQFHAHMPIETIDKLRMFVKECQKHFPVHVALAGGDPSAHPDFAGICTRFGDIAPTTIVSHGAHLTSEIFRNFAKAKQQIRLQISLASTCKETHKFITGSDTFEDVVQSLAFSHAFGIPLSVSVVVVRDNVEEAAQLVRLAAEFDARKIIFNRFLSAGRGMFYEERFSFDEPLFQQEIAAASVTGKELGIDVFVSEKFTNLRHKKLEQPKLTVGIDGTVRLCSLTQQGFGNIEDHPVDLYNRYVAFWRSSKTLENCFCSFACSDF